MSLKNTITEESTGEETLKPKVFLIKMHGSLNWAYCDSCQDVREFDLEFLKETYEKDTLSYPVMGLCIVPNGYIYDQNPLKAVAHTQILK